MAKFQTFQTYRGHAVGFMCSFYPSEAFEVICRCHAPQHIDMAMSKPWPPLIVLHVAYHPPRLIQSGAILQSCGLNTRNNPNLIKTELKCPFYRGFFSDVRCLTGLPPKPTTPWIWLGRGGTEAAVAWRKFPWTEPPELPKRHGEPILSRTFGTVVSPSGAAQILNKNHLFQNPSFTMLEFPKIQPLYFTELCKDPELLLDSP